MYCLAPMVDGSDLPFRLLLNNVTHAWTQMYNCQQLVLHPEQATEVVNSIQYEKQNTDHVVVLQFVTNSVKLLEDAYSLLKDNAADYVEINFGCSQAIAQKGNYGSYLLDNMPLCLELIRTLKRISNGKKLSLKTRLFENLDYFFDEAAKIGVELFTLHGRKAKLKLGCFSGSVDYDQIFEHMMKLKLNHKCLFIVNGGIWNNDQAKYILNEKHADGVMCATYILQNPFIFESPNYKQIDNSGQSVTDYLLQFVNCFEAQRHLTLQILNSNQIQKIAAAIKAKDYFAHSFVQKLDNFRQNQHQLSTVDYALSPAISKYPQNNSLSQDILVKICKEADENKNKNQFYILNKIENKINCQIATLMLINNHIFARKRGLESPWSAVNGHVIRIIGTDVLNANVDVRYVLTNGNYNKNVDSDDEYQKSRIQIMVSCVGEIIDRLLNGQGYFQ